MALDWRSGATVADRTSSLAAPGRPGHGRRAMPSVAVSVRVLPRLRRTLVASCLAMLILAPLVLAVLVLDTAPRVDRRRPARRAGGGADPRRGRRAQGAGGHRRRRRAAGASREAQINAVLASAQRLPHGARRAGAGRAGRRQRWRVAAGAPLMPGGLWLNLDLAVAPSEDGRRASSSAAVGRLPLPPALALRGADAGARPRARATGSAARALARVDGGRGSRRPRCDVVARLPAGGPRRLLRPAAGAGAGGGGDGGARAGLSTSSATCTGFARRGELPRDGSVLPYLEAAVRFAAAPSEAPDREEMRAALYALALSCGDPDFGAGDRGRAWPGAMQGRRNGCERHHARRARRPQAAFRDLRRPLCRRPPARRPSAWASSRSCSTATSAAAASASTTWRSDAGRACASPRRSSAAPRGDWPAMLARIGERGRPGALARRPAERAERGGVPGALRRRRQPGLCRAGRRDRPAASRRCRSTRRPRPN